MGRALRMGREPAADRRCPQCGAPVPAAAEATRCPRCNAVVPTNIACGTGGGCSACPAAGSCRVR